MLCRPISVVVLCLVAMMTTAPAKAGPWAQAQGEAFLSFGIGSETSRIALASGAGLSLQNSLDLYGEYGLGRRLTLGGALSYSQSSTLRTAFLRFTGTAPDATWQAAVEIGATLHASDGAQDRNYGRLGLSVGRGFGPGGDHWAMPLRHQGGWVVAEAVGLFELDDSDETVWQVSGTFGLSLSDTTRVSVQLLAEEWPGSDLTVTATPSVIFSLPRGRAVQLAGTIDLEGSDNVGLRLSIWQEF